MEIVRSVRIFTSWCPTDGGACLGGHLWLGRIAHPIDGRTGTPPDV